MNGNRKRSSWQSTFNWANIFLRRLFKDTKFLLVFAAGGIGTFPLFVPPFFLPLYSKSLGLSSSTSAILVAAFTFSSGVGRIVSGFCCDLIGSVNTLFVALMLNAITMVVLWPASTSLAPLTAFAILNGASNGGFFSTMPTVVGNVFGSQRVAVAMGMVVTSWAGGYLMVSPASGYNKRFYTAEENLICHACPGSTHRRLPARRLRRCRKWTAGLPAGHVLRGSTCPGLRWLCPSGEAEDQPKAYSEDIERGVGGACGPTY